jgi:hypothetical protein
MSCVLYPESIVRLELLPSVSHSSHSEWRPCPRNGSFLEVHSQRRRLPQHRPLHLTRNSTTAREASSSCSGSVHRCICTSRIHGSVPFPTIVLTYDLNLRPHSALCTAATWFHRFYMRFSLEDYHRQVSQSRFRFLRPFVQPNLHLQRVRGIDIIPPLHIAAPS